VFTFGSIDEIAVYDHVLANDRIDAHRVFAAM
jgi:hypothetical protein